MTAYSGSTKDVKDIIASCYYDLHRDIREHGHTFYNLPGGRGSCKSGQTSAGTSMEEALGVMGKPFADIVRNPVPDRDIADYE